MGKQQKKKKTNSVDCKRKRWIKLSPAGLGLFWGMGKTREKKR
jgi:hypothetical protein